VGIDDREYMKDRQRRREWNTPVYDPKEFRGPTRAPGEELLPGYGAGQPRKRRQPSFVASLLGFTALLIAGALVIGAVVHWRESAPHSWSPPTARPPSARLPSATTPTAGVQQQTHGTGVSPSANVPPLSALCVDEAPRTSGFWSLAERVEAPDAKWIRISNLFSRTAFFVVSNPMDASRIATAIIHPGDSSWLRIRGSSVSLSMSLGTRWCNRHSGWLDGVPIKIMGGLRVDDASRGATLEIRPGAQPSDVPKLLVDQAWIAESVLPGDPDGRQVNRGGAIASADLAQGSRFVPLTRTRSRYTVQGAIAGTIVDFVVDTGATTTAVPYGMGRSFGVSACVTQTFKTATGQAQGCVARVSSIRVGTFEVKDVEIALVKSLSEPLLGMNVLKHFQMVSQGHDTVLVQR